MKMNLLEEESGYIKGLNDSPKAIKSLKLRDSSESIELNLTNLYIYIR
jgi:hypothetical protein